MTARDDDSFIFEENLDDEPIPTPTDLYLSTPDYILGGILAGLYYLPPEFILKSQTGWGRKIRYLRYHRLPISWTALADRLAHEISFAQNFERVEMMRVNRVLDLNQTLSVGNDPI